MPVESALWAALAVILPLAAAAPFVGAAAYIVARAFKGAGEAAPARVPDLTNVGVRIGDGASVLRFGLETRPTGRPAFRAETRRVAPDAF